jgi:hypothetical protein
MVTAKAKKRMAALIAVIIVLLTAECVMPFGRSVKYITSSNEITYKQYAFIPYGDDEASLGHYIVNGQGQKQKAGNLGPNSFSVAEDGSVYILDTLKYRINRYSSGGAYMYSVPLPSNAWGLDFEVAGDTIYLMHGDSWLYKIRAAAGETDSKGWEKLDTYSIISLAGLYSHGPEVFGRAWDGADILLTGSAPVEYLPKVAISNLSEEKKLIINKGGVDNVFKYAAQYAGAYIIKDAAGIAYIYEYEALRKYRSYAELRICKYVNGEKKETALAAPLEYYINSNPFKKLYLTEGGDVFQLLPLENGVEILKVPWLAGEKTRITQEMIEANEKKP